MNASEMTSTPAAYRSPEDWARARIQTWWQQADILPHYPASDEEVLAILQSVEYAVDPDRLFALLDSGSVELPPVRCGRREWSATGIASLAMVLESRRMWAPLSKLHWHKKNQSQIAVEVLEAEGKQMFSDLAKVDLDALLIGMVEADASEVRELLLVAIRQKTTMISQQIMQQASAAAN